MRKHFIVEYAPSPDIDRPCAECLFRDLSSESCDDVLRAYGGLRCGPNGTRDPHSFRIIDELEVDDG